MSFFPSGYDYRAPSQRLLHLINVNTPDGDFGFIIGADGKFTDIDGKVWWGSQLIQAEGMGFGLNGTAQSSSVSLSFFEDPVEPSTLITDVLEMGADYVKGRPLTRYLQVFDDAAQMYAPVHAPRQVAQMIMDHVTIEASSDITRVIRINLEGIFRVRNSARRLAYNTTDHARQLGEANPSYEYIPTEPRQEKSLLG